MQWNWHYIEDDRGTMRKPCSIREAVKSSGLKQDAFVGRDDAGRFWRSFLLTGVCFTIGMQVFFLAIGIVQFSDVLSILWLKQSTFLFIAFGVPMGLMVKSGGWMSADHAKRAVLSIGYCPSCTYKIAGLNSESDGCTVCPECSAAWKLPSAMNSE